MGSGALLEVPELRDAGIQAAFTTRRGGAAPSGDCDLSMRGEESEAVIVANRKRVLEAFELDLGTWTSAEQVHGTVVKEITLDDQGAGSHGHDTAVAGADGLVTSAPGIALVALAADCVPILIADPERRRVGVVHAGWRGTVAGVIEHAVQAFEPTASTVAVVGPAIGPCCYEVGPGVIEPAVARFGERVVHGSHLDLWEATTLALRDAGVPLVLLSALCTRCEPNRFFSHRAGATGRHALVAAVS